MHANRAYTNLAIARWRHCLAIGTPSLGTERENPWQTFLRARNDEGITDELSLAGPDVSLTTIACRIYKKRYTSKVRFNTLPIRGATIASNYKPSRAALLPTRAVA